MTKLMPGEEPSHQLVQIENLPKTALQAIYHAVTGKTENMYKELRGSVVITSNDIDTLYDMIVDQLGHYEKVFGPTVTVVVKHADEKTVTYSSWPRFKALKVHHLDVTSEVTIKVETVIRLPDTPGDQRCILSVNLDSALPLIEASDDKEKLEDLGWFFFLRREWRTVKINVDFVDFLFAKVLTSVVEEWFKKLNKTPGSRIPKISLRLYGLLRSALDQSGRLGMAVFMACYALWRPSSSSLSEFVTAGSIALSLWAFLAFARTEVIRLTQSWIGRTLIPTVILLTDGDVRAYDLAKAKQTSASRTALTLVGATIGSICVNIVASSIYARL